MRRKPCHHESSPSNSIQMTTFMSPWRNGSNEPVSLWTSQRGKQDMSDRERSTGKQEEHSFLPQGLGLASILSSPLHWFDSQCWSPKTLLYLMNERQLHLVLCQNCLSQYNYLTPSLKVFPLLCLFLLAEFVPDYVSMFPLFPFCLIGCASKGQHVEMRCCTTTDIISNWNHSKEGVSDTG